MKAQCLSDGSIVEVEVVGACPFCGETIGVERDDDGKPVSVLHTEPMCDRFIEMEPQDFISAAAQRIEKPGEN